MLILMLIVLTILLVFTIYKYKNAYSIESSWSIGIGFTVFGIIVVGIATLVLGISISNERALDEKIIMYQEENEYIQQEVSLIVRDFLEFEKDVYEGVKNESPIVLVQMFPEIKSDVLVGRQIDLYIENNNKIRELKVQKINLRTEKFWLYFG